VADPTGKATTAIDLAMKTADPAKETVDRAGKAATAKDPNMAARKKGRRWCGSNQEGGYARANQTGGRCRQREKLEEGGATGRRLRQGGGGRHWGEHAGRPGRKAGLGPGVASMGGGDEVSIVMEATAALGNTVWRPA
jgi:hypothetical protein